MRVSSLLLEIYGIIMIDRWVILNLPCREDRRIVSIANAIRLGVPVEKIRFWHGYDLADFESFEHARESVAADIPELDANHNEIPDEEQGKYVMLWNVARYLRGLSERGNIEAFVHDGLMMGKPFRPSFAWFQSVVEEITDYDPDFKLLTISLHNSWYSQLKRIDTITPSSFISKGILSWDNFAKVYSSAGAKWALDRILTQRWGVRCNSIVAKRLGEPDNWDDHCYSTIMPLGSDYPTEWLGSDSFIGINRKAMTQEFGRLFKE